MGSRTHGPNVGLPDLLAEHFTVFSYDRRGRGESSDRSEGRRSELDREIEDLAAVIAMSGGPAHLYGHSSGAAVALEAARRGLPVSALAFYEPPFTVDASRPPIPADFADRVQQLLDEELRDDAVRLILSAGVGLDASLVVMMSRLPDWSTLTAVPHALPYDIAAVHELQTGTPLPPDRWSDMSVPALVLDGGASPAWTRTAMRMLARNLRQARYATLPDENHLVRARTLAPALLAFFTGPDADLPAGLLASDQK